MGSFALSDNRLQSFGQVRDLDVENRRVRVVASTNQRARDEAVIDQRGWNFQNWDRNPCVLWAHDDRALPIARAIPGERIVTDSELVETHQFANTDRAREVFELVRDGYVNAISIRWLPGETEMQRIDGQPTLVFTRGHQPLEQSYVPIPADTGAMVLRADGAPLDIAAFDPLRISDEGMSCCAADCRNRVPTAYALCDECRGVLDMARNQRAAKSTRRTQRLTTLADKFRTANQNLKGEVA